MSKYDRKFLESKNRLYLIRLGKREGVIPIGRGYPRTSVVIEKLLEIEDTVPEEEPEEAEEVIVPEEAPEEEPEEEDSEEEEPEEDSE